MTGKTTSDIDRYRRGNGQFGKQPPRPEPSGDLTLTATADDGEAVRRPTWSEMAASHLEQLRARIADLESAHWQDRETYDKVPSSSQDPALKARGAVTWDDAVHTSETRFRTTLAKATDLAEKHYRAAGCKYAHLYARDMVEAAMTRRQAVQPIVKRSGAAAASTKAAVKALQSDPEWEPLRAETETAAADLASVAAERAKSRFKHLLNDRQKQNLLDEMNRGKERLRKAYAEAKQAESAARQAEVLDASGVPADSVPVGLRDSDVLRMNPDGSTNLWVRRGSGDPEAENTELYQRAVAARPMDGPGGGIQLKLEDGTVVSSVAREERQFHGRPRVRPGADLELYAAPAEPESRPASEVFGGSFARVGGYDDLY